MKKTITLLTVFYCVIINAQKTPITQANFQTAINTCLTTNPLDGLCSDSEYGVMKDWDVSQVTDMREAFYGRTNFNGDIGKWDVSNVINMFYMFRDAIDFNQDLSSWDVSNVTGMIGMFLGASDFNQNISGWRVGNVTLIGGMFSGASDFNQNISSWDVSNVINMNGIFEGATAFNQDLSYWCVKKLTARPRDFSRNSALSEANNPVWGTCNTTWKGTTDNNWNTATNWNTDLYLLALVIYIPSGLTIIHSTAQCHLHDDT
jgi:bacterial surface protein 26-residue repeat